MSMMPKTTTHSSGMATTKTSAHFTSMVKAMIMAPKTMKGLRSKRRSVRFNPFWTWLISLVILVIRVLVPRVSSSAKESFSMWSKSAWRSLAAKPTLALAAKYWAVMLQVRPMAASRIRRPQC